MDERQPDLPTRAVTSGRRRGGAVSGAEGVPARGGGVERIVEGVGGRLAARGHDVTVYCRREYAGRRGGRAYRGMRLLWTPAWPGKYTSTLSHAFTSLG